MGTAWEKMGADQGSLSREPASSGGCLHRAAESRGICPLYLGHGLLLSEKAHWFVVSLCSVI